MISASSGSSFSLQAFFVLPSTVMLLTLSEAYPVGVVPPNQRPVFASLCMLSRIRSAMVSCSSWLNTDAMYIIARPMGLDVSKLSRMDTKSMPSRPSSSIRLEKSLMLRLMRSRR